MLVPRLRRLCAECCFVCQNFQFKSYSAALCVICLALLSGALWICIQPTTLAFKLLSEAFCFVTHNNLMDYCAISSSKIYPIFRLLLTCYSVLFSSPHIAESMEGFGNTTWPYFEISFYRFISWPTLISVWVIFEFLPSDFQHVHFAFSFGPQPIVCYTNYYFILHTSDYTRQQQTTKHPLNIPQGCVYRKGNREFQNNGHWTFTVFH